MIRNSQPWPASPDAENSPRSPTLSPPRSPHSPHCRSDPQTSTTPPHGPSSCSGLLEPSSRISSPHFSQVAPKFQSPPNKCHLVGFPYRTDSASLAKDTHFPGACFRRARGTHFRPRRERAPRSSVPASPEDRGRPASLHPDGDLRDAPLLAQLQREGSHWEPPLGAP